MSLYEQLIAAGVTIESEYSDMFVLVSEITTKIIKESGRWHTEYKSHLDGKMWYNIPHSYDPFLKQTQVSL